jgi:hypothetical protein
MLNAERHNSIWDKVTKQCRKLGEWKIKEAIAPQYTTQGRTLMW